VPGLPVRPGSSSPSRSELSPTPSSGRGGAHKGAASARPPEVVAFEREYPGASWLSAQVVRELESVGSLAEARIAAVARRYGLSHAALNAMAVIEGSGGPMAVGTVSAAMHITSGTMTSVLDTLERNGLIERLADPDDRRRVLVDVTPAAQEVLDQLLPEVVQAATAMMAALDEAELRQFLATLERIRRSIAAMPDDLGPRAPRRTPPRLKRS